MGVLCSNPVYSSEMSLWQSYSDVCKNMVLFWWLQGNCVLMADSFLLIISFSFPIFSRNFVIRKLKDKENHQIGNIISFLYNNQIQLYTCSVALELVWTCLWQGEIFTSILASQMKLIPHTSQEIFVRITARGLGDYLSFKN